MNKNLAKKEPNKLKFLYKCLQMLPYMIETGKKVGINFSYGGLTGNTL